MTMNYIFGIFWHFLSIIGNVHPKDVMANN